MTNPSKRKENGVRGSRSAPPTNAFPVGGPGGPGRPKDDPEFVAACRDRTMKALATLDKAMDNFEVAPAVAVKAAEVLLNRGWGTAPTTIKLDATVKGEVTETVKLAPIDPARLARIAGVLQQAGVLAALEAKGEESA